MTSPCAFVVLIALLLTPARSGTPAPQPPSSNTQHRKPTAVDAAVVEQRLSEAVRREPSSVAAHHALAAFYVQQRRLSAAIPHLERAQVLDPSHYASGYDLALALLETGKLEKSREQVTRMLSAHETGELHNLLGDIAERAGNLVGAAEAYQRAAHMDATEEHLFDWGNNLVQLRAFEPATEVFTAAIVRHPKSARLHVGLGIAQYSRGQYADAVTSFCEAADLAPADPRPYQFLGEMYGVVPERGAEVTTRLARFVKAQPRNALAHLHYALSLWKGQPPGAAPADLRQVETLLRRAIALDPKLAKAFVELGILLSDQQRYQDAIPLLRRAVRLQPDLAQAHYRLAHAYQRTGQKALATKEFEIFERLKPDSR